jgi:hypothetical protein
MKMKTNKKIHLMEMKTSTKTKHKMLSNGNIITNQLVQHIDKNIKPYSIIYTVETHSKLNIIP